MVRARRTAAVSSVKLTEGMAASNRARISANASFLMCFISLSKDIIACFMTGFNSFVIDLK